MKHITLVRFLYRDDVTFGVLHMDGMPLNICTVEEPWKDNQRGISCIPKGTYKCTKYNGTINKDVWYIQDVENRKDVLIHIANTTDDIEGCIGVGLSFGKVYGKKSKRNLPGVLNSTAALNKLRELIGPNSFMLTIE